eukprot:m.476095 g.476095  ORF g.476095 m.476095 type:complete len:679 (+) comp40063_c0_seq1:968-3004(+)
MEYWLRNMSVRIQLPTVENVTVDVWVDANADVVRVSSSSDLPHRIEATLQIWRNSTAPYPFASTSWCSSLHPNVSRHADTVVSRTDSILFYHRVTAEYASMWETDLSNQQMPKGLPNVLINNTFGGLLSGGADGRMVSSGPMSIVSATGRVSQTLSIAGIADVYPKVQDFIGQLEALSVKPADPVAHSTSWSEFWSGSDISIKPAVAPNDTAIAGAAALVTRLDRVNRATFYSMALGKHAIKFNSYGIYSAYAGPGQEDYRVWGECQWFQNIRLPYYHMLHDGRFEAMKSLFDFYFNLLPVSEARTRAWFNLSSGSYFPETLQQNGLYASGGLGWNCRSASMKEPLPGNTYIRYHREGGLELSLLALDWFAHTDDVKYFVAKLLPQIESYVDYYANHFGNDASGKLDMFPAQALETWQCKAVPPTRETCVTNPMPEVAGLSALLPRLLALNSTVVSASLKEKWAALLTRVPPIPVSDCVGAFAGTRTTCLRPGKLIPPSTSNSENAELYAVHPYRQVGLYRDQKLGITSYYDRKFHGDTGWSEDFMDAALLGLANETAMLAVSRASVPPYTGYRWLGFQAGIGAGGPITDHGGVATAGLRYMLMQTGVLNASGVPTDLIVLFPAWPCQDWAVDFKLHAPANTIVEGSYNGAGVLTNFSVTPSERRSDVVFGGCVTKVT